MKKVLFFLLFLFFIFGEVGADTLILNAPQNLDSPTSARLKWYVSLIDADAKVLKVKYQFRDIKNKPIRINDRGKTWIYWTCKDVDDSNPSQSNVQCIGAGNPYECCTGIGEGTCDEPDNCFSDVFGFKVRQQDVGTKIGIGLRTLIWNKMKGDILSPGNDGSFQQ